MADKMDILIDAYASGQTLSPDEREAVERALDNSATANEQLAMEYRLTELLRSAPLPAVNYDLLAQRISATLPAAIPSQDTNPSTANRAFWSRSRSIFALAASVLIIAGITIPLLKQNSSGNSPFSAGTSVGPRPIVIRAVDSAASIASVPAGVQNVAIGPSPALAKSTIGQQGYAELNSKRPSQVVISGENIPSDDGLLAPR
jgi:anti-sigma factor RsiW